MPPWVGNLSPARPPRRRRLVPWLIGGGIAAALVIVLCVVAGFVAFGGSGSGGPSKQQAAASRSAAAASQDLARSATSLAELPAARYKGILTGRTGEDIPVEITMTGEGSAKATLTVSGEQVEAISLPDGLYVKASESFWRRRGAAADTVADFGTQWVKAQPDLFGNDLTTVLSPGVLARLLDPRDGEQAVVGRAERIGGVEARPMRVDTLTAYVTTAEPHRIVRLTSDEIPASSDPPSPMTTSGLTGQGHFHPARAPAATGFAVDVAELTDAEVDAFFKDLEAKVRGLKDALDSRVRFSLDGAITLAPCTTNGCRANVTISNRVQTNSPYISAKQPVTATVSIAMTLDGRPVNTCNNTVTMPPNGSVTTTCFAAYVIPPSRNPKMHTVEAQARTVARALVQADVDRLVNDLVAEFARSRRPRGGATATPTAGATPTGTATATPQAVPTPSSDPECQAAPFLDGSARAHIRARHYPGGRQFRGPRRDSEWRRSANLDQLVQASAAVRARYQPSTGRCVRVLDAADFIGTRPPGVDTRQYTVVHLQNGKVWTMHPGPPERY